MTRTLSAAGMATRLTWLLAMALVLAGCRIHIVQETIVNEDGSGLLRAILALDDEAREAVESLGADETDIFDLGAQTEGWDVQDWAEDDLTGIELTRPFAGLDDVAVVLGEPDQTIPVERVSLTQDGDDFFFEATLGDPAALEEATDNSFFDAEQVAQLLSEFVETEVRMQLPGDVQEHNADRVEDGVLIWDIDVTAPSRTLMATSTIGGGPPIGALAAGAGAVVLAAAVVFLVLRRPKRQTSAPPTFPGEPTLSGEPALPGEPVPPTEPTPPGPIAAPTSEEPPPSVDPA